MSVGKSRSLPSLVKLALSGAITGSLIGLTGCFGIFEWHEEDDFAWCDEIHEDCLRNARTDRDRQWCEDDVRYCYETCGGVWDDDGDDDRDDDREDNGDDNGDGDGGDDSGDGDGGDDSGDGDGDGTTGEEEPGVCIQLFSNCIDAAETLADVEACELLYAQCADPGECPEPECGCPADELEVCLEVYTDCTDLADTPEKVELCGEGFDTCTAPFADHCAVDQNPNLEPCLDQHALCIACAHTDEQVAACQGVFDSCMLAG